MDDGQANGTIATQKDNQLVRSPDKHTLTELGLSRQRLTEARLLRDHYTDALTYPAASTVQPAAAT